MPSEFLFSRRSVVTGALALAATSYFSVPAAALNKKEASILIGKVVDEVNRIINSGKSEKSMFADFEKMFATYADVPIIARSSLGIAWKSASSKQRSAYVAAFRGYISRKYGRRFREFIGGKIVVTGAKKVKSGYLVYSMAHLKGSAPFTLDWQVSDKSGKDLMFNLYIEGISLLATERTEIAAMLDKRRGNLNKLIKDLNAM